MPSKKTPTKTLNKSDFIRNQPAKMSAAEVVAKAKDAGIKFTSQLVYNVRDSRKKRPAKATASATTTLPILKPNPLSKSEFIRSQPTTLTAAEVVAKAKASGLKFDTDYVYKARRTAKSVAATKPTVPAPKSAALSTTPAEIKSKADVVRAYPSLSPNEVVEKAKAAGVKFDVRYVYRVRAMDKTARKKKRAAAKTTDSAHTNGVQPSVVQYGASSSAEDLLRAVAAEMGLGRAIEVLAGERARVTALIAG